MKRLARLLIVTTILAPTHGVGNVQADEEANECSGEQVVVTQMGEGIPAIVRETLLRCDPEFGIHLGEGKFHLQRGDVDVAMEAFRRGSTLILRIRDGSGHFGRGRHKFIGMLLKGLPMEQQDFIVHRSLPDDRHYGSGQPRSAFPPVFRLRERVPGKIRVSVVKLDLPASPASRPLLDRLLEQ